MTTGFSIRTKLLMVTVLFLGALIAVAALVQVQVIGPSFQTLEQQRARDTLKAIRNTIDRDIVGLGLMAGDWAYWDQTYEYVVTPQPEYVATNLQDETLPSAALNLLLIEDLDGRVLWGKAYDLDAGEFLELPDFAPGSPLLKRLTALASESADGLRGLVGTSAGPMLIVALPILTTAQTGPARGFVLMGRLLNGSVLADVGEALGLTISATTPAVSPTDRLEADPVRITLLGPDTLCAAVTLTDVFGQPLVVLSTPIYRSVMAIGRDAQTTGLVITILAGLVLIAVFLFSLQVLVLGPLRRLTERVDQIRQHQDPDETLPETLNDEFGTLARAFNGMLHDIRQHTEALEQETRKANQLSHAKSDFLANMSHEIRTPMNAVLGLAYLLTRQNLPEEARTLAQKIQTSGQSLLGIINDILDVSKIEAGKIELEHTPFQLSQVLGNLATIMAANAQDKGIELLIVPPSCCDWTLNGDPQHLGQVLINLTNNAIKFTDAGVVEVRIELMSSNDSQVQLLFTVRDTGIGIDTETQARLFQPFVQADSSTRRRFGGSGLGLVIARRLVELMGGTMRLDSTPGQGSTFWFELPFEIIEKAAQPEHAQLPMWVLVVAEHPDLREALLGTVNALGWPASLAASADAALSRLSQDSALQGPDAAVLIALSTEQERLATAQAIRAALPESQCPLLFALGPTHAQQSQASDIFDAVLTKPLTLSPLVDAVVLARHRRLGLPVRPTQTTPHAERLTGLRLLVVDDNEVNREVAQGVFTDEGAQVSLACDGQDALDWLMNQGADVDAVLMDIQMPVMDGLEATRAIRQHPDLSQLPVIALTAGVLPQQREEAQDAGVDGFLSKPFDVEQAVALIGALTGRRIDGQPGGSDSASSEAAVSSDFPGLNLPRALAIWKDVGRYRQYLSKFATEERNAAHQIADCDPDAGQRRAHALKGAAGNLGLDQVAARAGELERLFHTQASADSIAESTTRLQAALESALDSIGRYVGQTPKDDPAPRPAPQNPADPEQIAALLRAAHKAFSDFEPTLAEAPVSELAGILPAEQLAPLRDAIANLDASAGAKAARALANELGLVLKDAARQQTRSS